MSDSSPPPPAPSATGMADFGPEQETQPPPPTRARNPMSIHFLTSPPRSPSPRSVYAHTPSPLSANPDPTPAFQPPTPRTLIPGLPNELWRLIVLHLYHSLPPQYREHTVHQLLSISRAWRDATQGTSALWELVTFGRAEPFPSQALGAGGRRGWREWDGQRGREREVTLPDYGETRRGSALIPLGVGRSEEEGEEGQRSPGEGAEGGHAHPLPGERARPAEEHTPASPTSISHGRNEPAARHRFLAALPRSPSRAVVVRITLPPESSLVLSELTGPLLSAHAGRIRELEVDVRRELQGGPLVGVTEQAGLFFPPGEELWTSESPPRSRLAATPHLPLLQHLALSHVVFATPLQPIRLLQNTPSLRTLTIHHPSFLPLPPSHPLPLPGSQHPTSHHPLSLPHLHQLSTDLPFLLSLLSLSPALQTPSLTSLHLTKPHPPPRAPPLTPFLHPPEEAFDFLLPLRTLGLSGAFEDPAIERLLLHTPKLRTLVLIGCGGPVLCREVLLRTVRYPTTPTSSRPSSSSPSPPSPSRTDPAQSSAHPPASGNGYARQTPLGPIVPRLERLSLICSQAVDDGSILWLIDHREVHPSYLTRTDSSRRGVPLPSGMTPDLPMPSPAVLDCGCLQPPTPPKKEKERYPKPLMFDLQGCRGTTASLGMELLTRRRGVWMP